ncbi:Uncharacterised protein [Mycolicibacterium thermoresistibile]|nr:Uncharacterised protein [Mycolicibacterium thermoresistibile]
MTDQQFAKLVIAIIGAALLVIGVILMLAF